MCVICEKIPDHAGFSGFGGGIDPPELALLIDRSGKFPDIRFGGETTLKCPRCLAEYDYECDVGFGEWYITVRRRPTPSKD